VSESTYFKKVSSESILKNTPFTFRTPHVGLAISGWAVDPVTSTVSGELSVSGYSRVPIVWSDFVSNMTNTNEVLWSVSVAWPNVVGVFISDAFQGGNVLLYDSITAVTFDVGDIAVINIGDLVIS